MPIMEKCRYRIVEGVTASEAGVESVHPHGLGVNIKPDFYYILPLDFGSVCESRPADQVNIYLKSARASVPFRAVVCTSDLSIWG